MRILVFDNYQRCPVRSIINISKCCGDQSVAIRSFGLDVSRRSCSCAEKVCLDSLELSWDFANLYLFDF